VQIIPVIDLKGGCVVRACRGERAAYAPMRSSIAAGCEPVEIAAAFLQVYPFGTLYLADLDAIRRHGDNGAAVAAIHARFPDVELWVDAGIADVRGLRTWQAAGVGRPVIGSECVTDGALVDALRAPCLGAPPVLSIDFGVRDDPLGAVDVVARPATWPDDVIVMTLARVGAGSGPDWDRLEQVQAAAAGRRVYAAGGVRGAADLSALRRLGVAGALVASALHDGRLTAADLARISAC
jgi:phosphoribosylformimino-5-aminoimidazole carboxamide ribotide isomerase